MNKYGFAKRPQKSPSGEDNTNGSDTVVDGDDSVGTVPSAPVTVNTVWNFPAHKTGQSCKEYLSRLGDSVNINNFSGLPRLGLTLPVHSGLGVISLTCNFCGKVFINHALLSRHRVAFHAYAVGLAPPTSEEAPTFDAPKENKALLPKETENILADQNPLVEGLSEDDSWQYLCEVCSETFSSGEALMSHKETHTHV
jgi:hypothetical protein